MAANSGKMYQRVEQNLGRTPEVQIRINHPYLNANIDLVDQTVIEILVFEHLCPMSASITLVTMFMPLKSAA